MENQDLLKEVNRQEQPPTGDRNGTWVKVDRSAVGFDTTNLKPGEPVVGPDGATYVLGAGSPGYQEIEQGRFNAVPTPNNIVQMTPIVQPIALVPYASQNQPMLQYDPYQRPEAPKTERQVYKRKPYPAISLILAIIALAGVVFSLISVVIAKEGAAVSGASGFDVMKSIFAAIGLGGVNSAYYDGIVAAIKGNSLGMIFAVLVFVSAILFLILFIRYLVKLVKGKSPRNFSILALVNILVTVGAMIVLFLIEKELNEKAAFGDFMLWKGVIGPGIGLYASVVLSLIMFILPLCPNRHAYVRDHSAEDETFIIKE